MLTWKRGKVTGNNGFGSHTIYTATLSNGTEVAIKSVEGTFFFYANGERTHSFADTLKEAKAIWQRCEDRLSK